MEPYSSPRSKPVIILAFGGKVLTRPIELTNKRCFHTAPIYPDSTTHNNVVGGWAEDDLSFEFDIVHSLEEFFDDYHDYRGKYDVSDMNIDDTLVHNVV
jgi:hypothetical protein